MWWFEASPFGPQTASSRGGEWEKIIFTLLGEMKVPAITLTIGQLIERTYCSPRIGVMIFEMLSNRHPFYSYGNDLEAVAGQRWRDPDVTPVSVVSCNVVFKAGLNMEQTHLVFGVGINEDIT